MKAADDEIEFEDYTNASQKDAFNDDFETFQGQNPTQTEEMDDFGDFEKSTEQEVFESPMKTDTSSPHLGIYDMMIGTNEEIMMSSMSEIMNRVLPNLYKDAPNEQIEQPQGSLEKLFKTNQSSYDVFEKMAIWNGSIEKTQFWKSIGITKEQKPTTNKRNHTRNVSIYESTELQPKATEIDVFKVSRDELRVETKRSEVRRDSVSTSIPKIG